MNDPLGLLRTRILNLDALPTLPVILKPLLHCLDQPAEEIDVDNLVEMISQDESMTAQCLRLADSALFMCNQPAETIRTAVTGLGLWRVRDLLFANSLSKIIPANCWVADPAVFWRHSLGVALVCRKFAEMIDYPDPEKAYLAGLLHDIGTLVSCMAAPNEFRAALEDASRKCIPLDEAEQGMMGYTHSDTGRILADAWKIPTDIADAIELHHRIGDHERGGPLVALVNLSDLLCRMRDLGYGYYEIRQVDFAREPGWLYLVRRFPAMANIDLARFTFSLDEYAKGVSDLVATVFAS